MKRVILILCLFAAGCATTDPRVVAFEAGKKRVDVDLRVLYSCPDLPKLKSGKDSDLIAHWEATAALYAECRAWKDVLNGIVRDAFNTDEPKEAK